MKKFIKNLKLVDPDITISWIEKDHLDLPETVRKCEIITSNGSFNMVIDERFNQINFSRNSSNWTQAVNFLIDNYHSLLSSDYRYKIESGIEGTRRLHLEEFIDFLKTNNRDITINHILDNDN